MLHHKTIIITGASSGLGKALAEKLAGSNNQLVLFGRDLEKLEQTAINCRTLGAETLIITGDISRQTDCQQLIEKTIAKFGKIDILINNAGVSMWRRFADSDLAIHQQLMATNYFGALYCTYYAIPYLQRTHGMIVAISSVQGLIGTPYHTGYSATKHALQGFFTSLRLEIGDSVNILIVSPSWLKGTKLRRNALGNDNKKVQSNHGVDAAICADKIINAIEKKKQELIIPAKFKLFAILQRILPKTVDKFIKRIVNQESKPS